ncbi:RNA polymerase sigma factor [Persicitalea jodogahamensis]|uniref:RNA polymerase n=1 Tax=Persicitalea jodogahamensis TaxID=402147 RepID=A0A8J3DDN1_9BACT|nr:sigma-70 family RNA polymerase sigma factor [Persicitalea jodogahamensis]GHB86565.1 RNA polymerase [Persicitalea jodogahamensis]
MDVESLSDTNLWKNFLLGNTMAFAQLYKKYQQELFGYAFRILRDRDEAKSAMHELFAQLWQKRDSLPAVESPKAYLFTALRRSAIRSQQRNRIFVSTPVEQLADNIQAGFEYSAEDLLIASEQSSTLSYQLTQAINRLPQRQREIIYLRYYQQLSLPQISQALEISYQTVANHLQAAYKALSKEKAITMLLRVSTWLSIITAASVLM